MRHSNILTTLAAGILLALPVSCDKFLDQMPDNRAEIDTRDKVRALLVSAYPATDYMLLTEFMSDNVDDYGKNNPYTDRFIDQVYAWQDVTETDNEDSENVWGNSYLAIAAANESLAAIETLQQENPSENFDAERAEALLCRAYNHFILVNLFCQAYDPATASTELGIPYMEEPETTLNPKYPRGTVAEVYEKIEKDLQTALPLVSDTYYTVPKYHFNPKAAYAFAARFYLYYEKYAQSVTYANKVLGSEPSSMLRDWKYQASMTQSYEPIVEHYIDAGLNCNLLLMTAYSKMGLAFGPYSVYSKYAHGEYLANRETGIAITGLWGGTNDSYYSDMKIYSATNLDKTIFWKLPFLFEYTDPVAQIGYYRTVYPAFAADQVLLERAEANTILGNYDSAVRDINLWIKNIARNPQELTPDYIREYFNNTEYSEWNDATVKKHLHPTAAVQLGEEGGMKECILQCVLALKRVETLGQGLRWFDIKRYGIEIDRRIINAAGRPDRKTDTLVKGDPRRAIQIPPKVVAADMEPNPRNAQNQ
jgi:hypothetical protein